jgi:hypothetical protein
MDNAELTKHFNSSYASMRNELNNMIPIYKDIRNFIAPRTARFEGEQLNDGTRQDLDMINSNPRDAVRVMAYGLQSGVTSPMRPWFTLGLPDPELQEYDAVKDWLYLVEKRMRDVFARSNIYDKLQSTYRTLGTYGTACFGIDEDDDGVLRAYDYPIGTFMVANDATGRTNVMYRDVWFTAIQMYEKFKDTIEGGEANLPQGVLQAKENGNYSQQFHVVHIVEPNKNYKKGSALSKHKKYASVYWLPGKNGNEAVLSYKGYDFKPFMAPRWDLIGEDVYGYGCGELALGDSKQMQLMEKRKLQGIDKNTHPTMLADASMRNQRTSSLPGDTVYVSGLISGNPGYRKAYDTNPYIGELREEIANVNERIDRAFFKNLFMMVSEFADQPNITATQINTMREEKLLMLGPVLERLNEELLDPLISITFDIMMEAGMIPEPPEEIQGMNLKIEYISILAQAQKALKVGNIERFVGFIGNYAAQKQDPSVWDKVNDDETIDEYAEGVGIPATMLNSQEKTEAIRAQRAEEMAQARAMEQMQMSVDSAKKLSETKMTEDSALSQAIGMTGAG